MLFGVANKEGFKKHYLISTLIATLNTFQIKTLYYEYWYAAYYLNLWQK